MLHRRRALLVALAGSLSLGGVVSVVNAGPVSATHTAVSAPTPTARPVAAAACTPGVSYGEPLRAVEQRATMISGGFNFLEGPVWIAEQNRLLVSDMQPAAGTEKVQPSVIRAMTPAGAFSVFAGNAGSNGLARSADGTRLLAATHDQRNVSSFDLTGGDRRVEAATLRVGTPASPRNLRFNSPNDLTVRSDGTVYFTDPNFQRGNRRDDMSGRTGVYRVRDRVVYPVDETLRQPNGIVLSPDEKTLYVGANGKIYRYPVLPDGRTGPRADFAEVAGTDGATVDCAGNIYWASYSDGRIHVFAPDGRKRGTIIAGTNTTNAAFGGADGRTLFITSGVVMPNAPGNFAVYQIYLNVPGSPY
ncbi:MAG TPA: SMP-30/gluconolactonase/LRE family protein [Micromonosporaceae bacterium]|nr:SMP-30/gluconolactonase/LRE family protein [Micromonosporaceae bacterium]